MLSGRVQLRELRDRPGTTKEVAALSGIAEGEVLLQLQRLNEEVRELFGYSDDAIVASSAGSWRADGVAGLLRLNPQVEIEVVPKFLDPATRSWQADFFLLALLVRTGHVLLHDEISAGSRERGDLATIIARSLVREHSENTRRPIRKYRRTRDEEFAVDGDVEWETTVLPEENGFVSSRLHLTRRNPFNATLHAAVAILIDEVTDPDARDQLHGLRRSLAPQGKPPRASPPLPARYQSWEQAYSLARLVLEGFGLDLQGGAFTGPGFVISTWAAWESVCEEVVRRALPDHRVRGQELWELGRRASEPVFVKPDVTPRTGQDVNFLLDAKYKTRADRKPRISAADMYESLAFARAAEVERIFLLYPALQPVSMLPLGGWRSFDRVDVGATRIEAFEVQIQGVASKDGFQRLVAGAREALAAHVPDLAADSPGGSPSASSQDSEESTQC